MAMHVDWKKYLYDRHASSLPGCLVYLVDSRVLLLQDYCKKREMTELRSKDSYFYLASQSELSLFLPLLYLTLRLHSQCVSEMTS